MAKPHGSVRIGPISLFTLIIILCLAVLAVLSLTTARAELSITERQAATTTETYQLERVGQTFLSEVDSALKQGDLTAVLPEWGIAEGAAPADAAAAEGETIADDGAAGEAIADESMGGEAADGASVVRDSLVTCSGTYDGTRLAATFAMESGRQLACVLSIQNDTYTLEEWKVTTQWIDDGTGENLWLG